jgi:hypothetical protein
MNNSKLKHANCNQPRYKYMAWFKKKNMPYGNSSCQRCCKLYHFHYFSFELDIRLLIVYQIAYSFSVQAYGEIDPYFAHKYGDDLDEELKLYSCGYLHLCTWNRDAKQPRITNGWTEIREHFELPFQFHLISLAYYGDSMFHLMPCLTKELPTNEFSEFHTLSTKPPDPFSFEIVLSNTGYNDRQLVEFSSC